MTIKINDLKAEESFLISVWRKASGNAKGGLVASSSPKTFYYPNYKLLETGNKGWEKIQMEFFISEEFAQQTLVVYAFNEDQESVYFDDLEIIRYTSVLP